MRIDISEGVPVYPFYKHLALPLEKRITFGSFSWACEEVPLISEDDPLKQAKDEWNKLILGKGFVLTNMLQSVNFELHVQEPFFSQLKGGMKTVEGRFAVGDYNREACRVGGIGDPTSQVTGVPRPHSLAKHALHTGTASSDPTAGLCGYMSQRI
ncbi:hypothetical protein Ancab_010574 [Ancistrocladus abbreviatus]